MSVRFVSEHVHRLLSSNNMNTFTLECAHPAFFVIKHLHRAHNVKHTLDNIQERDLIYVVYVEKDLRPQEPYCSTFVHTQERSPINVMTVG